MGRLAQGRPLALALVLAACGGGGSGDDAPAQLAPGQPSQVVEQIDPSIRPAPQMLPAADPKLEGFDGWPLAFEVVPQSPGTGCTLALSQDGMLLTTLDGEIDRGVCRAEWSGRGASAPGTVRIEATLTGADGGTLARTEAHLEVVRLGVMEVQLAGDGRVPLMYPKMNGVRGGFYVVPADRPPWRLGADLGEPPEAVSLEHADGSPRALPEPWSDLTTPPTDDASGDGAEHDTYNLPTGWVAGSVPAVTATLSADVAGMAGGGEPEATPVRVVLPGGGDTAETREFAHATEVTVTPDETPVSAVGRYDWSLEWRFEAQNATGAWVPIPGRVVTTHRLYGLVDRPIFDYSAVPHRAWVDVVDTVAGWVDGETAVPTEVAGHIVEGVYFELGLQYDTERGASFYTDYPSGSWSGAEFEASHFQDRAWGSIINCSDAASIVSTYANMVGLDFRYHILEHETDGGFDLNYIQAIGYDTFDDTPFDSGRGAFRYHAVVGPADGSFYDSTLALDGDGMPASLPAELLLAKGMDPDAYKEALSSEWYDVVTLVDEQVEVR